MYVICIWRRELIKMNKVNKHDGKRHMFIKMGTHSSVVICCWKYTIFHLKVNIVLVAEITPWAGDKSSRLFISPHFSTSVHTPYFILLYADKLAGKRKIISWTKNKQVILLFINASVELKNEINYIKPVYLPEVNGAVSQNLNV